jgi:hypothetical protein
MAEEAVMDDDVVSNGASWKALPISRAAELDDVQLTQAARAAFGWLRHVRTTGGSLDPALVPTLVDLQREFVQRFPSGDLSAAPE